MMPRKKAVVAVIWLWAAVLSGCASERYVRGTTQTVADNVASLQRDLARYERGHEASAARRIDLVMRERRQVADGDEEVAAQLRKVTSGQALYARALGAAGKRISAERARAEQDLAERKALVDSQSKVDIQAASQLEALVMQLKDLSAQPNLKDRAAFLGEYFKRTKKAIEEAEDAAKKSAEKAGDPAGGDH